MFKKCKVPLTIFVWYIYEPIWSLHLRAWLWRKMFPEEIEIDEGSAWIASSASGSVRGKIII